MSESNPILRAITKSRATPEEKYDALQYLNHHPEEWLDHLDTLAVAPDLMAIGQTAEAAQEKLLAGDQIVGLSTGYRGIDAMTKGLDRGEVSVVFGYTSHGKSQLTQNIALNVARTGAPVLLIPLEMTAVQNTVRFLKMTADIATLPILYPVNKQIRWKDINSLVKAAAGEGAKLVVIDQLQQLSRNVEHQTNEISLITQTISEVAKIHDVHIILISHVSRTGSLGPPDLPDLKGSSSIEQDADICLSVWRNYKADDDYDRNTLQVFLRKNRNRGMQITSSKLQVQDGVRLVEPTIDTIFPGAVTL